MPFTNQFRNNVGVECGLVHYLPGTLSAAFPVQLNSVNVEAKVISFLAEITITQHYVNKEANTIEAIYLFPIEESAAVIEFQAEIEGKTIKTVVKETEKARQEYQKAVSKNQTALMLEEVKADIFQIKVGNLKSKSNAKVVIKYLTELPWESGAISLTIPTTIAPRYIPPTDDSEEAKIISNMAYKFDEKASMSMLVKAMMKSSIESVTSPTHALLVGAEQVIDGAFYTISATLQNFVAHMDRDVVLHFKTEVNPHPEIYVEKSNDSSTAAMLTFIPKLKLQQQRVEIVFLVDRSGSMQGDGMDEAIKALHIFLHSLPADCFFNILSFGSSFKFLFEDGSQRYDDTSLETAKKHVSAMSADMGGTEIYEPLQAIFQAQQAHDGYQKQVIMLTDGQVSNNDAIFDLVRESGCRLFSLGVGSSASRHLVKGIARAGFGSALFAKEGEDLRPKVVSLLKDAQQPCLTDIMIEWIGDEQKALSSSSLVAKLINITAKKRTFTTKIPFLIDASRLIVYKIFDDGVIPSAVNLSGKTPDGPITAKVKWDSPALLNGLMIHQLAARKMIQEMSESGKDMKQMIIDLGCRYHMSSKFTSFIGVDDNQVLEIETTPETTEELPKRRRCEPRRSRDIPNIRAKRRSAGVVIMPGQPKECSTSLVSVLPELRKPRQMGGLNALISMQSSSGNFTVNETIDNIMGKGFLEKCRQGALLSCSENVWITAVISAIISAKYPNDKNVWELVIQKAENYIQANCRNVDDVMKAAMSLVQNETDISS